MNQWSVRPCGIVKRKVTHSLSTSSWRERIHHVVYCYTTAGKRQQRSHMHENQQQEAKWDASRGRKRMQVQGLTRERVAACLRRLLGPLLLVCASRPDPWGGGEGSEGGCCGRRSWEVTVGWFSDPSWTLGGWWSGIGGKVWDFLAN